MTKVLLFPYDKLISELCNKDTLRKIYSIYPPVTRDTLPLERCFFIGLGAVVVDYKKREKVETFWAHFNSGFTMLAEGIKAAIPVAQPLSLDGSYTINIQLGMFKDPTPLSKINTVSTIQNILCTLLMSTSPQIQCSKNYKSINLKFIQNQDIEREIKPRFPQVLIDLITQYHEQDIIAAIISENGKIEDFKLPDLLGSRKQDYNSQRMATAYPQVESTITKQEGYESMTLLLGLIDQVWGDTAV